MYWLFSCKIKTLFISEKVCHRLKNCIYDCINTRRRIENSVEWKTLTWEITYRNSISLDHLKFCLMFVSIQLFSANYYYISWISGIKNVFFLVFWKGFFHRIIFLTLGFKKQLYISKTKPPNYFKNSNLWLILAICQKW